MRTFSGKIGLSCLMFAGAILLPAAGWAANRTVDCGGTTAGAFTSLQGAIDSLDRVGPHQISVVTTTSCKENVQIVDRQRLTIIATSPNGGTFDTNAPMYVQRVDPTPILMTTNRKKALVMGKCMAEDAVNALQTSRCSPKLVSAQVAA